MGGGGVAIRRGGVIPVGRYPGGGGYPVVAVIPVVAEAWVVPASVHGGGARYGGPGMGGAATRAAARAQSGESSQRSRARSLGEPKTGTGSTKSPTAIRCQPYVIGVSGFPMMSGRRAREDDDNRTHRAGFEARLDNLKC